MRWRKTPLNDICKTFLTLDSMNSEYAYIYSETTDENPVETRDKGAIARIKISKTVTERMGFF